jgi:AraC-like DNA-binding protein
MDLLTDIFRQAGLRRRLLDVRCLADGAALQFPCDKSLGLHVVTDGRLFLHAPALPEPLALAAGDIALMARGCEHLLSSSPVAGAAAVERVALRLDAPLSHAPAGDGSRVISGAYQLWNRPVHPLFAEMPDWFVLRAAEVPRLGPLALSVALLQQEVNARQLGADMAVHGLLDMLFTCMMREMIAAHGGSAGATWCRAVRDPQIGHAVALLHDGLAEPWTLDALARRAGLSRTALAERFRRAMGDTPLNYLRVLRMQRAMRLLSESDKKLEQVAAEVGYQDAFGFSKVFKRTVGVSPAQFRRRDAEDRLHPWRIQDAEQPAVATS